MSQLMIIGRDTSRRCLTSGPTSGRASAASGENRVDYENRPNQAFLRRFILDESSCVPWLIVWRQSSIRSIWCLNRNFVKDFGKITLLAKSYQSIARSTVLLVGAREDLTKVFWNSWKPPAGVSATYWRFRSNASPDRVVTK